MTTWNYDALRGFLVNKQYADGNGPLYTNSPAGRLQSRTWVRGVTASYGYDNAGTLTGVDYSDGTPDVSYTFDRRGRLTQMSGLGTNSYAYNDAGLVVSEDYLVGSLNYGSQLLCGYDGLLRRTNLWNASLQTGVSYGYDAASRLQTVREGINSATYEYVANAPLVGQVLFTNNGTLRLTISKNYDLLNRLTAFAWARPPSLRSRKNRRLPSCWPPWSVLDSSEPKRILREVFIAVTGWRCGAKTAPYRSRVGHLRQRF